MREPDGVVLRINHHVAQAAIDGFQLRLTTARDDHLLGRGEVDEGAGLVGAAGDARGPCRPRWGTARSRCQRPEWCSRSGLHTGSGWRLLPRILQLLVLLLLLSFAFLPNRHVHSTFLHIAIWGIHERLPLVRCCCVAVTSLPLGTAVVF